MQGPPVFIPFESNAEDESNKIVNAMKRAAKSVQDGLGKAGATAAKDFGNALRGNGKAAQKLADDFAEAERAARRLVNAYSGVGEAQEALRSGGLQGPKFQELLASAQKKQAAGVAPSFTDFGAPVVDKRSAESAKAVREEFALTKQSSKDVSTNTKQMQSSLNRAANQDAPSLRYALYDVSNTASRIAKVLAGAVLAPAAASIKFERDFANVARTTELTGDKLQELRADLVNIAQTTPISWEDITAIGALAGQLGIAEESIANFTENVAKFSATTDLTVDASATAFGRLDQLIDGVNGQFDKLSSAILAVGVDSVATESKIVAVSTQIASMGNLAGLSAADIVGLSGSIASLGIAPELARGTVTRLFVNINQAVSKGGRELEEYGRLTGKTAQEFAQAWESEPTEALLGFFEGIDREGGRAEQTLREIGITSVRDVPAILRLAQSQDEVRRLVQLSNEEFAFGLKTNEQYGIIANTVAERLKQLGQTFEIFLATLGQSVGIIGPFVLLLNNILVGLTAMANNPIGAFFIGLVGIIGLSTAVFFALFSMLARLKAGMIGASFAAKQFGLQMNISSAGAVGLTGTIRGLTGALIASTGAARGLGIALLGIGGVGLVLGIIAGIASAIQAFTDKSDEAKDAAEAFFGDYGAFISAAEEDTKAFNTQVAQTFGGDFEKAISSGFKGDAISLQTIELKSNEDQQRQTLRATQDVIQGQDELVGALDDGTDAVQRQTIAYAENARAFIENSFIKDENIQAFASDPAVIEAFRSAGGDFQEVIRQSLSGTGIEYLDGVRNQLIEELNRLEDLRRLAQAEGDDDALAAATEQKNATSKALIQLDTALVPAVESTIALTKATEAELATRDAFNAGLGATEGLITLTSEAVNQIMNDIFGLANATKGAEGAMYSLGEEFAAAGAAGEGLSGDIQGAITSLLALSTDPQQQIANLAALMQYLRLSGLGTPEMLGAIEDAIYGVATAADNGTGSIFNYAQSQILLGGTDADISGILSKIEDGMNGVGKAAGGAAGKVKTLQEQFDELINSLFEGVNAIRSTEDAIFALGEAFGESGTEALYASDEIQKTIRAILKQSSSAEEGVANLAALFANLARTVGSQTDPSLGALRQTISAVAAQFGITEEQVQQFIATAGGGLSSINFENFNRGIQGAQQEVRTLLDYANDLQSVFSRAFDIRFARTTAIDEIADAWLKLSEQVEDARYELEELQESQSNLGADRGLKEYFLSIAEAYNDTLRAAQLRKELAELDREQADNARRIQEAEAIAGGDLTGQGPGERQNRQALLGLVQDYQSYITALAESGATQKELKDATEEARQEFIQQALELGFQEAVVLEYAAAFDDVQTAISKVERNITVEANVNPALQALNELNASLRKNISAARELNAALGQPTKAPSTAPSPTTIPAPTVTGSGSGYLDSAAAASNRLLPSQLIIRWNKYAEGGFTGRGGKFDPAGIVHKGEYVIPKQYVNQSTGMPDPGFLAQMQGGMRNYFNGGFVGGTGGGNEGTMMVELSPYDRKLLADVGNVQLRLNGKVVAEATNRANFTDAQRGTN
jgi:TP901 family phage tail tape measure protein